MMTWIVQLRGDSHDFDIRGGRGLGWRKGNFPVPLTLPLKVGNWGYN